MKMKNTLSPFQMQYSNKLQTFLKGIKKGDKVMLPQKQIRNSGLPWLHCIKSEQ